MKLQRFSASGHSPALAFAAVAATWGALLSGCGGAASTVCDDAGVCLQCDGYGCSTVSPGTTGSSSSTSHVTTSDGGRDARADALADARTASTGDAAHADAAHADAAGDAADGAKTTPVCGGTHGPCACVAASDCLTGELCVAGACLSSSDVCTFSSECPSGDVCADGRCLVGCTSSSSCAEGFSCVKSVCQPSASSTSCSTSADCPTAAPYCVSGACALACSADSQCPTGDYCDQGACVLDTRPKPNCTTSSDCNAGQVCQGGYCVYTCTASTQCAEIDARIPVCVANVCRAAAPQCTQQSDCPSGEDCVNNQCE